MQTLLKLINRFKNGEELSVDSLRDMGALACKVSWEFPECGLINPEDDVWDGNREQWYVRAMEAL